MATLKVTVKEELVLNGEDMEIATSLLWLA